MASDTTLAACPWCGEQPIRFTQLGADGLFYTGCRGDSPQGRGGHPIWAVCLGRTQEDADARWNRRAEPAGLTLAAVADVKEVVIARHPWGVDTLERYEQGVRDGLELLREALAERLRLTDLAGQPQPAEAEPVQPRTRWAVPHDCMEQHLYIREPDGWVRAEDAGTGEGPYIDMAEVTSQSEHAPVCPYCGAFEDGMMTAVQASPAEAAPPGTAEAERLAGAVERPAYTTTGDTTPPPDAGARELVQRLADNLAIATNAGCCGCCRCASPDHTADCRVGQLLARAHAYLAGHPTPPVDAGAQSLVDRLLTGYLENACGGSVNDWLVMEAEAYLAGYPAAEVVSQWAPDELQALWDALGRVDGARWTDAFSRATQKVDALRTAARAAAEGQGETP